MAVDVGSAVGYLDLDISRFLAGLKSAQSEADTASKNIATKIGGHIRSAGKSLASVGSTLTKSITVPIAGLGTAAIKTTSNFESAMSKVSAISGATGGDLDKLNKKAQEMGAKTKFSATESAEAFQYMAMAGWKTGDMLDGIEGIMNLAAADGLDLATTSDIVTDALTAFGLSAKDSSHFADVLAKTSSSANTNVSMLGESFKYVAPVSGALKYSVEDTALALGLMANAGIKGSQAGTSMRSAISRLVKPTDEVAAAMDKYNISLTNSDGTMKPLSQVMEELRQNLGSLSEAEQSQAAATLFGQEAMSGMLAIVNASDTDFNNLSEAIGSADGSAQQMADTMLNNLQGQMTLLKSALEGLAIQFGEILMPYIKQFVAWLQNLVQKLQEMTPEQKEQIVKWAAFAAAIGPVLLVLGKLISGIGSVIVTFGKIPAAIKIVTGDFTKLITATKNVSEGFALAKAGFPGFAAQASSLGASLAGITAPMIAIVAAIALVIAAFVSLWKNNEEFRNNIIAIWDGIKAKFESFGQGIVDRLNALGFDFENFTEVVKAIWDGFCSLLAPIFEGTFNEISVILGSVLDVLTGIFDVFIGLFTLNWGQAWQGIKEIFGAVWDAVKGTFESWVMIFQGIADTVLGWFGTTWNETWTNIKQFFADIWNGIISFFSNIITSITTAVSNFITTIVNFFAQLPTNIANFITNAYNSVVAWVSNMVAKAGEMGQNFLNAVISFFTNLPYEIGYFIGNTLASIAAWVVNMVDKAKEMGTNFINNVVSFFTQLPSNILQFITSAFTHIQIWAVNMASKAREMGINFVTNVVSFFTQLPGKVLQFITSVLSSVQTWATNMVSKAREMGTKFVTNVVTFIKQLPGKIKQFLSSAINHVKSWVTQMGQKGKEAVQSLIKNVVNTAKDIPDKVLSIGTDIIKGVWNGIQNAASWFTDKVKGFFSGIVDGVKDALGIGSPSKVFRDEVGKWLPPGVVKGFEAAMPSAMKAIQKDLNKGINNIDTDDISVSAGIAASGFADKLKSIYNEVALWFESIEGRIGKSVDSMMQSLDMLIRTGKVIVNSDGTLGYIGYNGFVKAGGSENYVDKINHKPKDNGGNGDTFIFNSPKAIDEIEAAKQMKKTKQDMAEGF